MALTEILIQGILVKTVLFLKPLSPHRRHYFLYTCVGVANQSAGFTVF